MIRLPEGPFPVIYADPPWTFDTFSDKGKGKSPEQHYSCMSIDDICALPVKDIADKDSVLFMWATWPTIFQAQKVIEAWGFTYSGLAWEWIKYNPKTQKFAFGCGYGTRKNVEPCLISRRGKPLLKDRSVRDFILPEAEEILVSERRQHSRKPEIAYARIESMFDGPYVELFARHRRPGWKSWGNEVGKFDFADLI